MMLMYFVLKKYRLVMRKQKVSFIQLMSLGFWIILSSLVNDYLDLISLSLLKYCLSLKLSENV